MTQFQSRCRDRKETPPCRTSSKQVRQNYPLVPERLFRASMVFCLTTEAILVEQMASSEPKMRHQESTDCSQSQVYMTSGNSHVNLTKHSRTCRDASSSAPTAPTRSRTPANKELFDASALSFANKKSMAPHSQPSSVVSAIILALGIQQALPVARLVGLLGIGVHKHLHFTGA